MTKDFTSSLDCSKSSPPNDMLCFLHFAYIKGIIHGWPQTCVKDNLGLLILLPPPIESQGYKHVPSYPNDECFHYYP